MSPQFLPKGVGIKFEQMLSTLVSSSTFNVFKISYVTIYLVSYYISYIPGITLFLSNKRTVEAAS